jgi:hypothetical protein
VLGISGSIFAFAALPVAPVPSVQAATASSTNAATLYSEAIRTTNGWSVHYTSRSTDAKSVLAETGDAGPASGTQHVAMGQGSLSDHASIVVIGDITYLKGNAAALRDLAGLPQGQATSAAGQWVEFATNNADLSSVSSGVRSTDLADELMLHGPYTMGPSRVLDGYRVDSVEGTQKLRGKQVRAVLYVRATGQHVPVEEDSVNAAGRPNGTFHVVYSKWGEIVRPFAPQATASIGQVSST